LQFETGYFRDVFKTVRNLKFLYANDKVFPFYNIWFTLMAKPPESSVVMGEQHVVGRLF
jgi:hypothetical protein